MNRLYSKLADFRRQLHQNPCLSGHEEDTVQRIAGFVRESRPDGMVFLSNGKALAVMYSAEKPGPVLMFRADTDALPLPDSPRCKFPSVVPGISHQCGHDGHTALLCGLALMLGENRPLSGKCILLFQPSEETGLGAATLLGEAEFRQLKPDAVFGFHNLSGFSKNTIIIRRDSFCCASTGLVLTFSGIRSHASEPCKGRNPARAIAECILQIENFATQKSGCGKLIMSTVVGMTMGGYDFGTSPGEGNLMITLRAETDGELKRFTEEIILLAESAAIRCGLQIRSDTRDTFPALANNDALNDMIRLAAANCQLQVTEPDRPFLWSEDFAYYAEMAPIAYFGIGTGEKYPPLHSREYEFNDELLETIPKFLHRLSRSEL